MNAPFSAERYTRWFTVADGELPIRVGVYEGSACGMPDVDEYAFNQMFYFWDGQRFSGSGRTTREAADGEVTLPVAHWRGLNACGMSSKVHSSAEVYAGTVALVTPHHFGLRIERLVLEDSRTEFRFTTEQFDPCTMEGDTRRLPTGWHVSSKLQATHLRSRTGVSGAVVFRVEQHDGRCFVYGFWKQEDEEDKTFSGELRRAR